MEVLSTSLREVKLIRPRRHIDERGWFAEVFNVEAFAGAGLPTQFAQDNQSFSRRAVLRGLHYQLGKPQGKLVRVLSGEIWDVAVDLRRSSSTFGQWAGFHLSGGTGPEMLWIPGDFAHGFLVLSESAEVLYKTTNLYHPAGERCIRWDDAALQIQWPLESLGGQPPSVSAKDALGKAFAEAELPPADGFADRAKNSAAAQGF